MNVVCDHCGFKTNDPKMIYDRCPSDDCDGMMRLHE